MENDFLDCKRKKKNSHTREGGSNNRTERVGRAKDDIAIARNYQSILGHNLIGSVVLELIQRNIVMTVAGTEEKPKNCQIIVLKPKQKRRRSVPLNLQDKLDEEGSRLNQERPIDTFEKYSRKKFRNTI